MPSKALTTINCHICPKKDKVPHWRQTSKVPLSADAQSHDFSASLPANSTKGIISSEGREVSICISNSVACGKMVVSCPKIGDTANPGKEVNAETDQMPTSVIRGIVPLPVLISYSSILIK